MTHRFDAIVIGGGSAGLAFSKEAASRGASVLLIERAQLGGTCVNRGCVPKKMMWAVADTMQTHAALTEQGIFDHPPAFSLHALADRRAKKISGIVASFDDQLADAGVSHVSGSATLQSAGTVTVGGTIYETNRMVLATGTRPSPLKIPGGDLMDLSDDVFDWTDMPTELVVIGGGYIGCEMAAIFNAFGARVTLVSNGPAVLTEFSAGSQKIAEDNLRASGVKILLNTEPTQVAAENGGRTVHLSDGSALHAARVLNATGRDPNLDLFGKLEPPARGDSGALQIDAHFQTSTPGIYAIGDIADRLPLTPVAREDGKVLAMQMFGAPETPQIDLNAVATTAFVLPPIGEVGITDDLGRLTRFTAMESMISDTATREGWALHRDDTGALTGVCVVGHSAAEAVSWAAHAAAAQLGPDILRKGTPVHPSKAEEPLAEI